MKFVFGVGRSDLKIGEVCYMKKEMLNKTIQEWIDTCTKQTDCETCPFVDICLNDNRPKHWTNELDIAETQPREA